MKKISEILKKMASKLNRLLSRKDFHRLEEIKKFLTDMDSSIDLTKSGHILFAKGDNFQLWVITSTNEVFIIKDDGELKCIYRKKKINVEFNVIKENKEPRLYIKNTITTLPISSGMTGGGEIFEENFKRLINE